MPKKQSDKLTIQTKVGYGICDLGGNLFFTAIAFVLPIFLTDTVGLAPALAGIALLSGKFWDAIYDPVIGYLSDRTKSRWGRRRIYILAGSVPTGILMFLLFTAPGPMSQGMLFVWTVTIYSLLCTGYSTINIPYSSLLPELTKDYNERTSLSAYKMSLAVLGSLLGAGATMPLVNLFANKKTGFSFVGALYGAIITITALLTFFMVREPGGKIDRPKEGVFKTYATAFRNKPFLVLVFGSIMHIVGITVLSGSVAYYFKYIYKMENLTPIAMVLLLVTAMAFIPVWVQISKKIGKKLCMIIGMFIIVFSLSMLFFFAQTLGFSFFLVFMVVAGIGLSTQYVFPYPLLADVVEYDYSETHERKEGVYFGLWIFSSKVGQALAGAMIGFVLSIFKYVPDVPQSAESMFGIRMLFGPIPLAIYLVGAIIMCFYPITKEKYEEILKKISKISKKAE